MKERKKEKSSEWNMMHSKSSEEKLGIILKHG